MLNGLYALCMVLLDVIGSEGTMLVYASWDSVHDDLLDNDGRVLAQWREHLPGFNSQASRSFGCPILNYPDLFASIEQAI